MVRKTPRDIPHTCVTCGKDFLGTPKATRCSTCRASGRRAPLQRSSTPPSTPRRKPKVDSRRGRGHADKTKECLACGNDFLGQPRAIRCEKCKRLGKQPRDVKCVECGKRHAAINGESICKECDELFSMVSSEVSPEEQAELDAARRFEKFQERRKSEIAWLEARLKKPKGHLKMNKRTAATELGKLWVQLCAYDGATSSVLHSQACSVSEADKVKLLTSFYKLRFLGYRPEAIVKVCPKALLKDAAQAAIADLPTVTERPDDFDPLEGADETTQDEISNPAAAKQQQQRQAQAQALGLI